MNIKEESLIYPTFRDERIESLININYNINNYTDILLSTIILIKDIKEIIVSLIKKLYKKNENENDFIIFMSEFNINIKSFLTNLFFLKRRINLLYDLQEKKITINDFINQNKNPFLLIQLMNEDNNFKKNEEIDSSFEKNENDLFYELFKEEKIILDKISFLKENYIPNIKSFCIGLNILNLHLNDAYNIFKIIQNSSNIFDIKKEKQLSLCKILFKIQSCGLLICNLYFLNEDNIFNEEHNSKHWISIKSKMKRINVSNKKAINEALDEINNNLSVVFCSMNHLQKYLSNNSIIDNSMKGAFMAYFYIRKEEAKYEADKFLINPDINICQQIWGLTETKESKSLIKIVLPHIEFRKTFYITRKENDIINNEIISELINIIKNYFEIEKSGEYNKILNNTNFKTQIYEQNLENNGTIFETENIELTTKRSFRFKTKKELKTINKDIKKENYIKLTLLHNSFIKTLFNDEKSFFKKFLCCDANKQFYKNKTKDSIIIHIHGGGFITLSPLSHENYTRKIVNKTGIPLISVDYRLSPEYAFPSALDDVYQTYTWLIENGENDLNCKFKNIILLGDSAGGNLILSLVYILIIKKMRLPNLIILAYPAVKMNIVPLSLSYLNSLYDPLLDYNLLSFCLKSYLGKNNDGNNPFLSPLYMDDKIVKNFPKLKIYGGTGDPLRDDYVEFFHKCNNANVDCQLFEFKYFPHGFLNYDYSFIMPQASQCTDMICDDINNFIDKGIKI